MYKTSFSANLLGVGRTNRKAEREDLPDRVGEAAAGLGRDVAMPGRMD